MEDVLKPFRELMQLNTRLFVSCLEGVDDQAARQRIHQRANNVAFISSHVIEARYFLAAYLGVEATNPFKEMLEGFSSIEEFSEFPVVKEILASWADVSRLLADRFETLTAEELARVSPQSFPMHRDTTPGGVTVLGGIAFLVQHESYHLGQLGFLRKCLGLDAMSYS